MYYFQKTGNVCSQIIKKRANAHTLQAINISKTSAKCFNIQQGAF